MQKQYTGYQPKQDSPNPIPPKGIFSITQKIKKIEVVKPASNISPDFKLIERPKKLPGMTYKLKTPVLERSIYITICNIKLNNQQVFPFEMFLNTKNVEGYAWMQALTVVISAIFRQTATYPDLLRTDFLVYQLKTICDPLDTYFSQGKRMPSVVAEVGHIVEEHLIDLGLVKDKLISNPIKKEIINKNHKVCPKCQEYSIIKSEGCETCQSCGYSKCG